MATAEQPRAGESRDPRKRHHATTLATARAMYAAGDAWSPSQIARYLAAHGTPVSVSTVRKWVVPGAWERDNQQANDRRAARRSTPRLNRMRDLRGAGLSYSAIAKVMRLDHGLGLTDDMVRHALKVGREP